MRILLKILLFLCFILSSFNGNSQYVNRDGYTIWMGNMYVGHPRTGPITAPISGVHLQLGDSATTKALWLPRAQDTSAITTPRQGMVLYSISDSTIYYRDLRAWRSVSSSSPSSSGWNIGGNLFPVLPEPMPTIGTLSPWGGSFGIITNSELRAYVPDGGFTLSNDTSATKIFTWNPTSKEWGYANWNNGGGGGGGSGNNIYNIDSTLASNRTVTTSGRYIQFYEDAGNYLKFEQLSGSRFTHLSTSGTFVSYIQNDAGGGTAIVADRTDNPGIGTGGLLYVFNDGTNLELSINNNISGLQNGYDYTRNRPYSLLATESNPIGVSLDSTEVRIGKGTGASYLNIRGIRVGADWQVRLDSLNAGPGIYAVRIAADGLLTYADTTVTLNTDSLFGKQDNRDLTNRYFSGGGVATFTLDSLTEIYSNTIGTTGVQAHLNTITQRFDTGIDLYHLSDYDGGAYFRQGLISIPASTGNVTMQSSNNDDSTSLIQTEIGRILFDQTHGNYEIDDLPIASNMTNRVVMVWDSTTNRWERIRKDSIGSTTPTPSLQQVLAVNSNNPTIAQTDISANAGGLSLSFGANAAWSSIELISSANASLTVSDGFGSNSYVIVNEDRIDFRPDEGLLIIDSLNYTLSTTGKKIMLRDTATGLVENIDPALIGATYTASNGITLTGNNFKWSGTLVDATTTINADGKNVSFSNAANFDIHGTSRINPYVSSGGTSTSVNMQLGYMSIETDLSAPNTSNSLFMSTGAARNLFSIPGKGGSTLIGHSGSVSSNNAVNYALFDSLHLKINYDTLSLYNIPYTLSTTGMKVLLRDTASGRTWNIDPALLGSGYTNLTQFVDQTAWRIFYSNGSGDVTELALGTSGQYLKSNGASSAPSWDTPGGSGTVTSVATNDGTGITGGEITTTGTLAIDTANIIATRLQVQHIVDSLAGTISGGDLTVGTTPILSGTANRILFEDGSNVLQQDAGLTYTTAAGLIVNDAGAAAIDLRAEGDTKDHLFFVDASKDEVYVGDATDRGDYLLQVNGDAYINAILKLGTDANTTIAGVAGGLYLQANATMFFYTNGSIRSQVENHGMIHLFRNEEKQGADVASVAGAIALGTDGNTFEITGTNAITLISNANWQNGSVVNLLFTSTATLTDGTANSGTDIGMDLGGSNFTAAAGNIVTLVLSESGGTQRWRKVSTNVGGGGGAWGSITGTLSDQTDLQSALDGKQAADADLTSWAGVTRASGFDTWTATPSSANLRSLVTDENGTGALLFSGATSPSFTTPVFSSITNTGTLTLPTVTSTVTAYKEAAITSNATWSPSGDARDNYYDVTAQAAAVTTISNPSGTAANHNTLTIRVKDDGTARALTWSGTEWRASSALALPTTTTLSRTMYIKFIYNSTDSKWDLVSVLDNFQ